MKGKRNVRIMGWVLAVLCAVLAWGPPAPRVYAQDEGPWIAVDFSTMPRRVRHSVEATATVPEVPSSESPVEIGEVQPPVDAIFLHGGSGG
jgi:hypothetical protein